MTTHEYAILLGWLRRAVLVLQARRDLVSLGTYRHTDCIKCAAGLIDLQLHELRSVRVRLATWFNESRIGIHPWVSSDTYASVDDHSVFYSCLGGHTE
jgi:hypothetical protein